MRSNYTVILTPRYPHDLGFDDLSHLVRAAGGTDRAALLVAESPAWVTDILAALRPLPAWALRSLLTAARGGVLEAGVPEASDQAILP